MSGTYSRRYAEWISTHSKLVLLLVLLATVLVAAGAAIGETEDGGFGEFEVESEESDAADFIDENYDGDDAVVSQLVVRDEGGDVLTRESLLDGLRLQEDVLADGDIEATLTEQGLVGIENLVGVAAVVSESESGDGQPPGDLPPVEEQREALEALGDEEVEELLAAILDPDQDHQVLGDVDPIEFLPRGYEPGETTADARLTLITQVDNSDEDEQPQAAYDAQVAIGELVDDRFDDAFVFGQGISDEASANATGDSFAIITPFALVLVLFVLGVAYRDVTDILLAIFGIVLVLAWLQGIMGWLEIPMNVILIAVPFLLIGLSIDYAVHVVMRYREARRGTLETAVEGESTGRGDGVPNVAAPAIRSAMALGLGSVVLALAAATFSTGVGFLSNVVSPLPAIQDFAVLSAGGIFATFVAFGVFLPALKIEVDSVLEGRFGRPRDKPAFGVSKGGANRVLTALARLASRAPLAVLVVALVLTLGGGYGATTIDTEFNQADFLPQDAPEWAEYLPGPLEPGTYTISDDFEYLSENFRGQGEGGQTQILLRGDVTSPAMLAAIDDASATVGDDTSIQLRPDDVAAVEGPHTAIRTVAAENETFAASVDQVDTTDDGLPNEALERIYAELYDADEEVAREVLSRDDSGEITSARLILGVQGDESAQTIADDTAAFAAMVETGSPGVTAVATGQTVTNAVLQDALLETLVQAFAVTLVVILVFLTVLFWVRYRSPSQGLVVVIPVVMALAWLLGAMALLDIPFNSETAVITSLAIGLGVDYSIHAGERFVAERDRRETLEAALEATVTGTGGALLASAATTAAGFGVLALSLSPPLQRFGLVTGTAIIFAFVAVVTVLPCLMVVRERLDDRITGS